MKIVKYIIAALLLAYLFFLFFVPKQINERFSVKNVIFKNTHNTFLGRVVRPLQGNIITAEVCMCDCTYSYGDNNQWDYNKREGITFNRFFPHKKNIMTADRWNDVDSLWEITFYNHGIVKGSNKYFSPSTTNAQFVLDPVLTVKAGECYNLERDIFRSDFLVVTKIWKTGEEVKTDSVWFNNQLPERFYFQNAYHGGTYKSPVKRVLKSQYFKRNTNNQ